MSEPLGPDEEHFRALADSAPVLIWMSDISMGGIYFNRAWLDFTGRSLEREVGRGWMEVLHPDDRESLNASYEALNARQPFQIQFRMRRRDGEWRWMLNTGKPRFNLEGKFTGYTGSCVDITERFEAEEDARHQLRLMRTITDNAAEALFLMDSRRRISFVNPAAERMFGWRTDDLIGEILHDKLHYQHPDGQPFSIRDCPLGAVFVSGKTLREHEDVFFRRDGTAVDVQCSIAPIRTNGRVDGAVLVVHDITDRKRAEEALRRSEDLFSAIFRQAIVGITQIDLSGRFLMVNDRFCEIVARPREEVLKLSTQDITHAEDVLNNMTMLERARSTGEDYQLEKRYVRPDGSIVWVHNSVSVMRRMDGRPLHLVAVVRDITEQKRVEAGMLQANRDLQSALTEREVLVKEVHHRVKNNLQVVVSLLRLQASRLRDAAGTDALRESLNRVSAMSTIHELLYRSNTLADIDFAEVLRTLTGNLHDAYGLNEERISMVVEADPVPVSMDAAVPLALIANELISNAFKHGFPDGAEGEVRVGLRREGETVVLRIADTGPGFVPPERSTSLGLMLVDRLVRQVSGRLELEPPPGTRYRLTFKLDG
jgi:two-component system, sensor histidine kinase PdtaS